jgi:hypothetical protein
MKKKTTRDVLDNAKRARVVAGDPGSAGLGQPLLKTTLDPVEEAVAAASEELMMHFETPGTPAGGLDKSKEFPAKHREETN